MSITTVPAAAAGLASTIAKDPVSPSLVPQSSSSSSGSDVNEDDEEEVLLGSVDHITLVSHKRSSKENLDAKETSSLLKSGNEQTQKTFEQIDTPLVCFNS